jgi:MYXO-CTERM domain-containing protein
MWWWTPAWAWNGSGIDWSWQDAPAEEPFSLNVDSFRELGPPDDVEAVFRHSLRVWSVESEADLFLEYGGRTGETRQGRGDDDTNVTVFGSRDFFAGLAVATTWQDGADLVDCDISVHERNGYGRIAWHVGQGPAPRGAFDLSNTLTHELGHCLGLAHSGRSTAMMSPYSTPGTGDEARHLTDDDREGIQALYGRVTPELVVEDLSPGAVVDGWVPVSLLVRNVGDGSAFDVSLALDGETIPVGDVGAPTPVGERVGPDEVELRVTVPVDCDLGEASLDGVLRDARGRTWDVAAAAPASCPTEPGPDEDDDGTPEASTGCGCASTRASWGWGAPGLLLAFLRRRR